MNEYNKTATVTDTDNEQMVASGEKEAGRNNRHI